MVQPLSLPLKIIKGCVFNEGHNSGQTRESTSSVSLHTDACWEIPIYTISLMLACITSTTFPETEQLFSISLLIFCLSLAVT